MRETAVDTESNRNVRDLGRRQTLPVYGAEGKEIVCISGELWITQEGDTRDIILGPGQAFNVDRPGLVLVHATRDSVLRAPEVGEESFRDYVVASAKRLRRAAYSDLWRRLRSRVLALAS
jgi:hypothetical protein